MITMEQSSQTMRYPTIRTTTTRADANPGGDIFGGWLLGQMDMAGGAKAYAYVGGRIVTVGVEAMSFHQPVFVGDEVSFYTDIVKIGRTSISIRIEAWVRRQSESQAFKVTEGTYTFVAIDENRKPKPISHSSEGVAHV